MVTTSSGHAASCCRPRDPKKGVETRKVADGVFVVTDGVWQSAFVVTDAGVIVFDAPETYAAKIRAEITAVTRAADHYRTARILFNS